MLANTLFSSSTGPSVEIGKAMAKGLGTLLKSKQRRMLALTAAGAGAGQLRLDSVRGCPCPISNVLHEAPHADKLPAPWLRLVGGIATLCPSLKPCTAQHEALCPF